LICPLEVILEYENVGWLMGLLLGRQRASRQLVKNVIKKINIWNIPLAKSFPIEMIFTSVLINEYELNPLNQKEVGTVGSADWDQTCES
jgi:hypothetical protein